MPMIATNTPITTPIIINTFIPFYLNQYGPANLIQSLVRFIRLSYNINVVLVATDPILWG